ncbi:MAG TPA: hypothetical protein PLE74_09810 [Candidatus Cloacimonadota bacterium]|nr:hypothetical protein [Candidatus Cloacimonadota bacterium]HPT72561.1 hypothetical protein [Candidatus Cloacimonadota bacterium]
MLQYTWLLSGKQWQISNNEGLTFQIPNHNGMQYLTSLIMHPSLPISYINLIYGGLYEITDQEFKKDYRYKLIKYGLQEEDWSIRIPKVDMTTLNQVFREVFRTRDRIEKYKQNNDYGMADMLTDELDKLMAYVENICVNTKYIRLFDNDYTKVRKCVQKAMLRILGILKNDDYQLAATLRANIEYMDSRVQYNPSENIKVEIIERNKIS